MAPINSIFIPYVANHWTPELIASTLYENGIAKASSIQIYNNVVLETSVHSVKIDLFQWMDTEMAYDFIMNLKAVDGYATLYLSDEEFWKTHLPFVNMEKIFDEKPSVTNFSLAFYDLLDEMENELIEDELNMDDIEELYLNNPEWFKDVSNYLCCV
jgi:hypothetical protein